MHIEPGDNGGFMVRHEMEGPPDDAGVPTTTHEAHPLGDANDLLSHVQGQFGGNLPAPPQAGM